MDFDIINLESMSDIELISLILKGFAAFGLSMMLFALLPKTKARRFLAIFIGILSMNLLAVSPFEECLVQKGEELRSLVKFAYPRAITRAVKVQIPKEIVVDDRRVEIKETSSTRWLWCEIGASPTNKGRILLGLEKSSSDAIDNAFEQIASISSLPIDRLASAVNLEQGDGFVIISLGDRTSIIVIDQYVISVSGRRDVNVIARTIAQSILITQKEIQL